jgi:hypothetical protein
VLVVSVLERIVGVEDFVLPLASEGRAGGWV